MANMLIVRKANSAQYLIKYMLALFFAQTRMGEIESLLVRDEILHQVATLHQFEDEHDVIGGLGMLQETIKLEALQITEADLTW